MITGKKLIGAGAEKYLPFALSKLRQYAAAWTGSIKSHNFQTDDGTTIMIELYAQDRAQITIISLSGFIVLGDKRTNYLTAHSAKTELFMGEYKAGFRSQAVAWSFTDATANFLTAFHFMAWQQVQPVPNGEAIVALTESKDFVDRVAVLHISKAGVVKTIFPSTPDAFLSNRKVFCLGPSNSVDHPGKYRYLLLVNSNSYLSQDSGATWANTTLPVGSFITGDFVGNGTVLIFMLSSDTTNHAKLYRSDDGVNWLLTGIDYDPAFKSGQFAPLGNDRVLLVESTRANISEDTSFTVAVTARLSTDGGTTFGAGGAIVSGERIEVVQTLALGTSAAAVLVLDSMTLRATIYFTSDAGASWTSRVLPASLWSPEDFFGSSSYRYKYLTLAAVPTKLSGGAIDINSLVLLWPVTEYTAAADAAGAATVAAYQANSVIGVAATKEGTHATAAGLAVQTSLAAAESTPSDPDKAAKVAAAIVYAQGAVDAAVHAVAAAAFAVTAATRAVTMAVPANAAAAATMKADTVSFKAKVDAAKVISDNILAGANAGNYSAALADINVGTTTPLSVSAEAAKAAGLAIESSGLSADGSGVINAATAATAANAAAGTPTVFAYYTKDGAQTWTKGGTIAKNIESNIGWRGDRGFASIEALTKTGNLAFSNFYSNNGVLV